MSAQTPPVPTVSVPASGRSSALPSDPQRTDPRTFLVKAIGLLGQLVIPLAIAGFTIFNEGEARIAIGFVIPIVIAVIAFNFGVAYLQWARLTYAIGMQDIRVESGVLSRSARSVPYERIQDVSLEQKLIPRLLGLVSVKFETGAGGGEDLSLAYLSEGAGEELRHLVRERRDAQEAEGDQPSSVAVATKAEEEAEALFTMGPRRLFTFGLFEFSLAVFAVLGGVLQYADTFIDFEVWDPDLWEGVLEEQGSTIAALGPYAQVVSAIAGLLLILLVGSATGMLRVFTREWDFLLERTARGFRRRRGLFTKTDVVMPIHRVQGVTVGTRLLRYRFGWHNLKFVSLAQDMGKSSHDVAPFARLSEIAPIMHAAGFSLPGDEADWHRASRRYRTDNAISDSVLFVIGAIFAGVVTGISAPEWIPLAVGIPLALAAIFAFANVLAWRFHRHAIDDGQVMATKGVLAPTTQIATRLKLHSAEIAQGPIAQLRGYATVHLGLAGGTFSIPGVPMERAKEVRAKVLETIAATDFSQLESQQAR